MNVVSRCCIRTTVTRWHSYRFIPIELSIIIISRHWSEFLTTRAISTIIIITLITLIVYYYLSMEFLIPWTSASRTGNLITVSAGVTLWREAWNTRPRWRHHTGYSCWYHISSSNHILIMMIIINRISDGSAVKYQLSPCLIHSCCCNPLRLFPPCLTNDVQTSYTTIMCDHGFSLPRYCM